MSMLTDEQIRASSLGTLGACALAWAGNRWRRELRAAHPDVEFDGIDYKVHMGSGFHLMMENDTPPAEVEEAVAAFLRPIAERDKEFFYTSEKFPDIASMAATTAKMVEAFRATSYATPWMGAGREGSKFETGLEADQLGRSKLPLTLTGHIDLITEGQVRDLKTGALAASYLYPLQLTAYRQMLEGAGAPDVKKTAQVIKVQRPLTPRFRTPIKAVAYEIDTRPHEKRLVKLVRKAADIIEKKDRWINDFTKLEANPDSRQCSFCPLRNTSACPATKYAYIPDTLAPEPEAAAEEG